MAIAVDPRESEIFITDADKKLLETKPEQVTKWRIRALPDHAARKVADALVIHTGAGGGYSGLGTRASIALKWGLVDTEPDFPLRNADGSPVVFDRPKNMVANGTVTDDYLDKISVSDKRDIANAILELGTISPTDEGKSES